MFVPFLGFFVIAVIFIVLIVLTNSLFTVRTSTVAIIERFGKFDRVVLPGLAFKTPFIETRHTIDMRIMRRELEVETKTQDNVFVAIHVAVPYQVDPQQVKEAYYSLEDPGGQIDAFCFDIVRSEVPTMTLDETFEKKDNIAQAITNNLHKMSQYGYQIGNAFVTDIVPDDKVKSAMNDINAAQREQQAAIARGEAQKSITVKAAEAESESKRLQGEGIAKEREAIAKGLQESIKILKEAGGDSIDSAEALKTLIMTQYLDTISHIGGNSKNTVIMIPHSISGMTDITTQITQALLTSDSARQSDTVRQPAAPAKLL